ncbi:CFI-box-CTERM domain-containing protein [Halomarina salina]|uniref:CFI-box-CTERM domain-containing protein n=1 Tax=Halomarina salina TaxID=1872699 RepID=A0ABD5RJZ3_9EURY|nr:CFI-box-CTERM domain-containing protein [Halomarina salina]
MPHTPVDPDGGDDGGGAPGADSEPEADGQDADVVEISDGREKYVSLLTTDGDRVERGDVFLQHSTDAFAVSDDPAFPAESTDRYAKADLLRFEVKQHHSACFVTTAAAGDGETLDDLRGFRDGWLTNSRVGGTLVAGYERVSPPVARTLARHPDSRTTRVVRRHVDRCARLARRQARERSRVRVAGLGVVLVVLYLVGVALAVAGHAAIRARELVAGEAEAAYSASDSPRLTGRRSDADSRSD